MRKLILSALCLLLACSSPVGLLAQTPVSPPKLVVNVVVSGLSWDQLRVLRDNLSGEGFSRFTAEGMTFDAAYYTYMQTLTPVGLATLTTGSEPSMHGVVGSAWVDYVTAERVELTADLSVQGLGTGPGEGAHSPHHLIMPTLGDKLVAQYPDSKSFSIAADPVSAVVSAGLHGTALWMDSGRASWHSSTHYMSRLPEWIVAYNTEREAIRFLDSGWSLARPRGQYLSRRNTIFPGGTGNRIPRFDNYNSLTHSPFGNSLVLNFAARILTEENLGTDDATDILTVCLDSTRWIGETYGPGSMEVEDMIYRLDMDLGGLVDAVTRQVQLSDVLFVITSDHGLGENVRDHFNVAQFRTILNSFLVAQFGPGEWVLDCIDREVFLNRNLVYQSGLSLAEVQNRAATFALQFRGVSHVLTSTALGGGYFGAGWGRAMQRSFYPRRGGDLVLNLMPGWIEQRDGAVSLSGSMYDYDTHVPLIFFGWQIPSGRVREPVDIAQVAPTIAYLLGLARPMGTDADILPILVK